MKFPFLQRIFSRPVYGLDVADQSVKYVSLTPAQNGFTVRTYGVIPLPQSIIKDGRVEDPVALARILKKLKSEKNIRRVATSLPESHLFILEQAGMTPLASHTRAHALKRALREKDDDHVDMIVNFGEHQTDISVVSGKHVYLSKSFPLPGNPTQKLVDVFGVTPMAAREVIHTVGLSREGGNTEVFDVLFPEVTSLSKKINEMIVSWRQSHGTDPHTAIGEVLLVGNNAHMHGLREYVQSSIKLPVNFGNPWKHVTQIHDVLPPIPHHEALGYTTAIGLALRK